MFYSDNMRQFLLSLIFLFLTEFIVFSETRNFSRWSFTAEYGVTYFFGDLAPVLPKIIPSSLQEIVFGATAEYALTPVWGLSLDYYHLPISGLSNIAFFKTNLHNSDVNATINFTKWIFPESTSKFTINGALGVGIAAFTSENRYPDSVNSPLIVNNIPIIVSSLPVTFLIEYDLSASFALGLKLHYRAYQSDNLEGIPYLNFKGVTNDYIGAANVSIRYKLNALHKIHMRNISLDEIMSSKALDSAVRNTNGQDNVKNDSCKSCTALEIARSNTELINKLVNQEDKTRNELDSVLAILSNYKQDTDGDGVLDYLDKCPNTPHGAHGLVDKNGCILDSDGDGIPDYKDNCPKLFGDSVNNGCPEVKKEVKELFKQALQGIQFETAKSEILPVSSIILNKIAEILKLNPTYIVEIQGHTDNTGKSSANLLLSENRAESVRKYLVMRGVENNRLTSHGYGDTIPVADNNTEEGRSLNRRVEFVVSFEK